MRRLGLLLALLAALVLSIPAEAQAETTNITVLGETYTVNTGTGADGDVIIRQKSGDPTKIEVVVNGSVAKTITSFQEYIPQQFFEGNGGDVTTRTDTILVTPVRIQDIVSALPVNKTYSPSATEMGVGTFPNFNNFTVSSGVWLYSGTQSTNLSSASSGCYGLASQSLQFRVLNNLTVNGYIFSGHGAGGAAGNPYIAGGNGGDGAHIFISAKNVTVTGGILAGFGGGGGGGCGSYTKAGNGGAGGKVTLHVSGSLINSGEIRSGCGGGAGCVHPTTHYQTGESLLGTEGQAGKLTVIVNALNNTGKLCTGISGGVGIRFDINYALDAGGFGGGGYEGSIGSQGGKPGLVDWVNGSMYSLKANTGYGMNPNAVTHLNPLGYNNGLPLRSGSMDIIANNATNLGKLFFGYSSFSCFYPGDLNVKNNNYITFTKENLGKQFGEAINLKVYNGKIEISDTTIDGDGSIDADVIVINNVIKGGPACCSSYFNNCVFNLGEGKTDLGGDLNNKIILNGPFYVLFSRMTWGNFLSCAKLKKPTTIEYNFVPTQEYIVITGAPYYGYNCHFGFSDGQIINPELTERYYYMPYLDSQLKTMTINASDLGFPEFDLSALNDQLVQNPGSCLKGLDNQVVKVVLMGSEDSGVSWQDRMETAFQIKLGNKPKMYDPSSKKDVYTEYKFRIKLDTNLGTYQFLYNLPIRNFTAKTNPIKEIQDVTAETQTKTSEVYGQVNYITNNVLSSTAGVIQDSSGTVLSAARDAIAKAEQARAQALSATTEATSAKNNASTAATNATNAKTSADAAKTSADAAKTAAEQARDRIAPVITKLQGQGGATATRTTSFVVIATAVPSSGVTFSATCTGPSSPTVSVSGNRITFSGLNNAGAYTATITATLGSASSQETITFFKI